jgi:hypothetical protein
VCQSLATQYCCGNEDAFDSFPIGSDGNVYSASKTKALTLDFRRREVKEKRGRKTIERTK